MKTFHFLVLMVSLAFISCDKTSQYDVYVQNKTNSDIEISYKSMKDKEGIVEKEITLQPEESQRIISTVNFNSSHGGYGITAEDCHLVAEYITAKMKETESAQKWCSESVKFQKEDIGQGSFTVVYTNDDF